MDEAAKELLEPLEELTMDRNHHQDESTIWVNLPVNVPPVRKQLCESFGVQEVIPSKLERAPW